MIDIATVQISISLSTHTHTHTAAAAAATAATSTTLEKALASISPIFIGILILFLNYGEEERKLYVFFKQSGMETNWQINKNTHSWEV